MTSLRQALKRINKNPPCKIPSDLEPWWRSKSLRESVQRMYTAIALGGGGATGDFQVGAIQYLYEKGVRPQIISGTSVGAVNAVILAEGEGGLQKMLDTWLNLSTNSDMYLEEAWFSALEPRIKEFINFSLSSTIWNYAFSPLQFLLDAVGFGVDTVQAISKVKSARSVYNLSPVRSILSQKNDHNKRVSSGIKLRLSVVGLESGKLRYVDELGRLIGEDPQNPTVINILDATISSASIPFAFPPVKLAGENCVDASSRESLPIQIALREGATRVFAIACGKAELTYGESFDNSNILDIVRRVASDIMPNEIEENEIHPYRGWGEDLDVKIVQPTVEIHDVMTIDPGLIRISISYGHMRAFDTVEGSQQNKDAFAKLLESSDQIVKLRKEIWDTEFAANGERYNSSNSQLIPVPDPDAFLAVRRMKKDLKRLVLERQSLGGGLPQDYPTWWQQWEHHSWEPLVVQKSPERVAVGGVSNETKGVGRGIS